MYTNNENPFGIWDEFSRTDLDAMVDCDCSIVNHCPRGPPPMPEWAEFIEPLLELEPEFADYEAPAPVVVPVPDKVVQWDWRPADMYHWLGDTPMVMPTFDIVTLAP
jgi:hypothetical protein